MQGVPTILVVEDDHLIQSIVEEALKEGGFEIVLVSSGEPAVELLDHAEGKYRALITDINLGRDKLDGWQLAPCPGDRSGVSSGLYERRQLGGVGLPRRSQ
jgi:CheY-like chemotaxis protein